MLHRTKPRKQNYFYHQQYSTWTCMGRPLWSALKKHLHEDYVRFWRVNLLPSHPSTPCFGSHSGELKYCTAKLKIFPEECTSKQSTGKWQRINEFFREKHSSLTFPLLKTSCAMLCPHQDCICLEVDTVRKVSVMAGMGLGHSWLIVAIQDLVVDNH